MHKLTFRVYNLRVYNQKISIVRVRLKRLNIDNNDLTADPTTQQFDYFTTLCWPRDLRTIHWAHNTQSMTQAVTKDCSTPLLQMPHYVFNPISEFAPCAQCYTFLQINLYCVFGFWYRLIHFNKGDGKIKGKIYR